MWGAWPWKCGGWARATEQVPENTMNEHAVSDVSGSPRLSAPSVPIARCERDLTSVGDRRLDQLFAGRRHIDARGVPGERAAPHRKVHDLSAIQRFEESSARRWRACSSRSVWVSAHITSGATTVSNSLAARDSSYVARYGKSGSRLWMTSSPCSSRRSVRFNGLS